MTTLDKMKQQYTDAKRVYYEDPNGKQLMTDREFDVLEEKIRRLDPRWKGFRAGAPVNKKTKVKLPVPIFSLDKVKSVEALERWLDPREDYVVMDKLDGAGLEMRYENGLPVLLATRGNGTIGGNVSYLIPHLRGIPKKVGNKSFTVRFEGLFSTSAFAKYKKEFDASRNAASGVLNRNDVHPAVKDLSVVAIQLLDPNLQMSRGLSWLKTVGFQVVSNRTFPGSKLRYDRLVALLKKRRAASRYNMDGLVLVLDKKNALPKSGNPSWGVAFKEDMSVENAPTATVKRVHWKVSSHGYLIPRIEINTIRLGDSKINFATAYNAGYVRDNGIGPGAQVKIALGGDIIPDIIQVVKSVRPQMPDDSFGTLKWTPTKVHVMLKNPKENADFRLQKIARTFSTLKIDFLRGRTVQKLIEEGYDNVTKIIRATPEDFGKIPGFKDASARKLWDAIHTKVDAGFPLTQLMDASGLFPRGVGQTRLDAIAEHVNLIALGRKSPAEIIDIVAEIPGFQRTTAEMVAQGLPKFERWMKATGLKVSRPVKRAAPKSQRLGDVAVTFTGYRDKEQEATVVENGGRVVPFGSKTTHLLVSPNGKASTKADRAAEKGIKVMTWDQFSKKFGV